MFNHRPHFHPREWKYLCIACGAEWHSQIKPNIFFPDQITITVCESCIKKEVMKEPIEQKGKREEIIEKIFRRERLLYPELDFEDLVHLIKIKNKPKFLLNSP